VIRTKRAKGAGFRGRGLVAALGGAMLLLAIGAVGCGGGNSGVAPFAGVWVANSMAANALHFPGADFILSGALAFPPTPKLTSPFVSPQDTLFDNNNNLWVVDGGTPATGKGEAVFRFLFNQVISLNTTPNPAPNFVITTLAGAVKFVFPQFAAFDSAGDLWVSDSGANPIAPGKVGAIFKFSTAQLGTGAGFSGTPAAVFTNPLVGTGIFNGPLGIAFDASGNLWVENNGGTTVVEIAAADVGAAAGVSTPPLATVLNTNIPAPGGLPNINNPWGILFDAGGNMWITNEQLNVSACSGSVVEFTKAAIGGGGNITPPANVVITQTAVGGTSSLCDPNGITMNKAGNIVVANAAGQSLAEYTASQITSSGNPTPHTFIVGAATLLNGPAGLTFGPLTLK
jgi:hypothetical protein